MVLKAGEVWTWVEDGEMLLRRVEGVLRALLSIVSGESSADTVVLEAVFKLDRVDALLLVGSRFEANVGPPWPLTSTTTVSILPRPLGPSIALVLSVRRSVARGRSVGGNVLLGC